MPVDTPPVTTPAAGPTESLDVSNAADAAAALELLDHRARRGLVDAGEAAPGRYLELDGAERPLLFALGEVTHIGRGIGADLRFDDARVSRRHAIVAWRQSRARLLDDRSANGTFVNGRRVVEADLSDGDVIRIGRVVLRYREIGR